MSILYCITSFRKNKALKVLLQSLVDNKYTDICVSDDNSNKPDKDGLTALEVCSEFKGKFKTLVLMYNEKSSQLGIARNKNRNLKYFFENSEKYDGIVLMDDDICIVSPKIEEHINKIKTIYNLHHFNGYWTDEDSYLSQKLVGLTGNAWEKDFPPIMMNRLISWHYGTQGCFGYIAKELAVSVGFMKTDWRYFYGAEHSHYSARLNMYSGWSPTLFPVMRNSQNYLRGQNIPNDYNISHEKIELNMDQYRESLKDIENGRELVIKEDGLPKKGEKLVDITL